MLDVDLSDKRGLILEAAMKVFLAYGFRRTTMADIADAAGISRPALYLEFKNKADIYRAGFESMLRRVLRQVDAELDGDGPLCERLIRALNAGVVGPLRKLQQSPHGAELVEIKHELAGDLGCEWNAGMEASIGRALAYEAQRGGLCLSGRDLTPADLARLIVSTMEGIKDRRSDWQQAEADLARVIGLMVEPLTKMAEPA